MDAVATKGGNNAWQGLATRLVVLTARANYANVIFDKYGLGKGLAANNTDADLTKLHRLWAGQSFDNNNFDQSKKNLVSKTLETLDTFITASGPWKPSSFRGMIRGLGSMLATTNIEEAEDFTDLFRRVKSFIDNLDKRVDELLELKTRVITELLRRSKDMNKHLQLQVGALVQSVIDTAQAFAQKIGVEDAINIILHSKHLDSQDQATTILKSSLPHTAPYKLLGGDELEICDSLANQEALIKAHQFYKEASPKLSF